jgi:hypothetical protein
MMKLLIFALMLTSFAFADYREEAATILDRGVSVTGVADRLDNFSQMFLGKPYGFGGPLGEGPEGRYDQDPLYRFDTFDCTTFVETNIALALSRDANEFEKNILEVRYAEGRVDYLTRNHFTDLWWIPNNIKNGMLTDITHKIGGKHVLIASAEINLPGWLQKIHPEEIVVPNASAEERNALLDELHSLSRNYSPETATVPYVEINWILKNPSWVKNIPHGAIVNYVRPNWDLTQEIGTHQNISHQALLFWKGKVLYQRHASTTGPKTVFELPFLEYIKKFENHPTLKGVHLMIVNE